MADNKLLQKVYEGNGVDLSYFFVINQIVKKLPQLTLINNKDFHKLQPIRRGLYTSFVCKMVVPLN